jgi:hypothetical protein
MAGFACFFKARFKEAMEHFHRSKIDPRELIHFFDDLKPKSWSYVPKHGKSTDLKERSTFVCHININIAS